MKILIKIFLITVFSFVTAGAAKLETNLVKGGTYRCYANGDVVLCTKSRCIAALIEEMQNKTSFKQRKLVCQEESYDASSMSKYLLRYLTNPGAMREYQEVAL